MHMMSKPESPSIAADLIAPVRGNYIGFLLLIGTGILWGTIGVVSKTISDNSNLDPVSISWLRAVIASPVCILAAWLILGKQLFRVGRRDFWFMAGLGVVLILYQWLYLAAIERIGVSAATLISLCGAPIFVAVVSTLALQQSLGRPVRIALAGAITGVALLVGRPESGHGEETLIGMVLALACAAGIGSHVLGMQSLAHRVHPLQTLAIGFTVGAILFAPLALSRGVSFDQTWQIWSWLLYLGVVPSSIAYLFYQRGLRDIPATIASIVTMLEPLIAAVLAWLLFQERLGIWGWAGGALLLLSIAYLATHSLHPKPAATATP
jgi:drug/metabolite transporter, DME family